MKKLAILLTILLILNGCAAAKESLPEVVPEIQQTEAPQEEEKVPEQVPVPEDPALPEEAGPQRYSYSYGFANMSAELPEGWSCDIMAGGVGDPCIPEEDLPDNAPPDSDLCAEPAGEFGLLFWPDAQPDVVFSLQCKVMGFGVCGTELTEETVTLDSGYTVWIGTYYGGETWDYVSFQDTPGAYVLQYVGTADSWTAWSDEMETILNSIRVAEGIIGRTEAIADAKTVCTVPEEEIYAEFDVSNGVWTVHFQRTGHTADDQTVWVDAVGTVLDTVYGTEPIGNA